MLGAAVSALRAGSADFCADGFVRGGWMGVGAAGAGAATGAAGAPPSLGAAACSGSGPPSNCKSIAAANGVATTGAATGVGAASAASGLTSVSAAGAAVSSGASSARSARRRFANAGSPRALSRGAEGAGVAAGGAKLAGAKSITLSSRDGRPYVVSKQRATLVTKKKRTKTTTLTSWRPPMATRVRQTAPARRQFLPGVNRGPKLARTIPSRPLQTAAAFLAGRRKQWFFRAVCGPRRLK